MKFDDYSALIPAIIALLVTIIDVIKYYNEKHNDNEHRKHDSEKID